MPSDIGPTVVGKRLRTIAGGELSAQMEGAGCAEGGGGCATRGLLAVGARNAAVVVVGGAALATVAGWLAFATVVGRCVVRGKGGGAVGGGVMAAMRVVRAAFGLDVAARN